MARRPILLLLFALPFRGVFHLAKYDTGHLASLHLGFINQLGRLLLHQIGLGLDGLSVFHDCDVAAPECRGLNGPKERGIATERVESSVFNTFFRRIPTDQIDAASHLTFSRV